MNTPKPLLHARTNFRTIRKESLGLTQQEFATRYTLRQPAVSKYECYGTGISHDAIDRIALDLDVNPLVLKELIPLHSLLPLDSQT